MLGQPAGSNYKPTYRSPAQLQRTVPQVTILRSPKDAPLPTEPSSKPISSQRRSSWIDRYLPVGCDCVEAPLSSKTRKRLRMLNGLLFLFHTTLAVIIGSVRSDISLTVPIYETRLTYSFNETINPDFFMSPSFSKIGDLYITVLVLVFFGLSAFFHLGASVLWHNAYLYCVEHKMDPFRWIEYFFSASIMFVLIAYICGTLVFEVIVLGSGLIATTMLFGWTTELVSRPAPDDTWHHSTLVRLYPHLSGYVPQSLAWFILLYTFIQNAARSDSGPPVYVYAIVSAEFVLFFSFGGVQLYQILNPPSRYIRGEVAYQILSFVSKGILGLILYTNVLFLSNANCALMENLPGC